MAFSPAAVTFDCAKTLLEVRWSPERSIATCAARLALSVTPAMAASFRDMFRAARVEYEAASRTRNPIRMREFWVALHAAWLTRWGLPSERAEALVSVAEELTYGGTGVWFRPYPDVVPCLERLTGAGTKMAVVSNWDSSLHRIIASLNLAKYFQVVIASLEEGSEKPDPALFRISLERLSDGAAPLSPECVVHVGDDPVDDAQGAHSAGLRALVIDRAARSPFPGGIRGLDELPEAFGWSA